MNLSKIESDIENGPTEWVALWFELIYIWRSDLKSIYELRPGYEFLIHPLLPRAASKPPSHPTPANLQALTASTPFSLSLSHPRGRTVLSLSLSHPLIPLIYSWSPPTQAILGTHPCHPKVLLFPLFFFFSLVTYELSPQLLWLRESIA